jgi:hypothetical protein
MDWAYVNTPTLMEIAAVLWNLAEKKEGKLATTTGGEPVHKHACLVGTVHPMDTNIGRMLEQGRGA